MASRGEDEVADKVASLKLSGEAQQHRGARSGRKESGGDDVWHEPKVRNEHDNRFNYPNRTYSRDGGSRNRENVGRENVGRDRGNNYGRDRDPERVNRDNWRGRGERSGDTRSSPMTESEKNFQEQQKARAEQRRIKMQMMMERQKDYVAKQKNAPEEDPAPQVERDDTADRDEDEEGKDEGDVWGHDGWDKIIHDSNPRRRNRPERNETERREEANRYINPHLRSQPKQEEWQKEQQVRQQLRGQEMEQKRKKRKPKNDPKRDKLRKHYIHKRHRNHTPFFDTNKYVPPQRKATTQHQATDPSTDLQRATEEDRKEASADSEGDHRIKEHNEEVVHTDEDEESDEDDGDEAYEDADENGDDVVLIMQVEISKDNYKPLKVSHGDVPKEVAERFCVEHGMRDKYVAILTENIQQLLNAQQQK